MNTIYSLIRSKTETWVKLEKESNQSLINNTLEHIEKTGMLRPPQKEAIETYLWIKFATGTEKGTDPQGGPLSMAMIEPFGVEKNSAYFRSCFLASVIITIHRREKELLVKCNWPMGVCVGQSGMARLFGQPKMHHLAGAAGQTVANFSETVGFCQMKKEH